MKKLTFGLIAVFLIVGVSLVSAFGFGNGFRNPDISEEEKAQFQEQRQAIRDAIENNDYEAWKTLMQQRLTEENFNKLVERHKKMSEMRESGECEGMNFRKGHRFFMAQ